MIIIVVEDGESGNRLNEAELILSHFGFAKIRSYLEGLKKWEDIGGNLRYPKFVTFEVMIFYTII